VRLRVRDTGTGMDEDTQQHLFEPFFTTKPQGRGTGMGLAMIYGIVQQSHGFIEIESTVGQGSAFSVYLPRSDGTTDTQPAALNVRSTFGSETILVVEDEEVLRNLVRDVLRTHGYALLVAGTGEEALAIAERHEGPIDLVMSDIVLPGMSGLELVDRMAKARPRAKVLLMSGYADETIARHGVLDPAVPFLQKPFQLHDLTHRVREVLDTGVASRASARSSPSSSSHDRL
jgi:two-component system, cell cycle sensor histidine kinase and response regulator CckA